jgi:hypothetical protein
MVKWAELSSNVTATFESYRPRPIPEDETSCQRPPHHTSSPPSQLLILNWTSSRMVLSKWFNAPVTVNGGPSCESKDKDSEASERLK